MADVERPQARVAGPERENVPSRGAGSGFSGRSLIAGVLIVLALILAPAAVLGTWVRLQLVDTDRFVATFAPLASDPEVQVFLADEIATAISGQLETDALVSDLFDGIRSLDLPPPAQAALTLLEAPAAQGIRALIERAAERVVESPQFAGIWEETLRVTHAQTIRVLQGDPDSLVSLGADGVIALDLTVAIQSVRAALIEQGIGVAERIPAVERSIPLLQSDALALVRTGYTVAAALGLWLPWLVLALLAGGVALARDRPRATALAGIGLLLVFGLLAGGIRIGRALVVDALSPEVMPAASAQAVYGQLTEAMRSTTLALILLAAVLAAGAWSTGGSRWAGELRRAADAAFARLRAASDERGLSTGSFGRMLHRRRPAIVVVGLLLTVLLLLLVRPISVGTVLGAVAAFLLLLLLVELLRRHDTMEE